MEIARGLFKFIINEDFHFISWRSIINRSRSFPKTCFFVKLMPLNCYVEHLLKELLLQSISNAQLFSAYIFFAEMIRRMILGG